MPELHIEIDEKFLCSPECEKIVELYAECLKENGVHPWNPAAFAAHLASVGAYLYFYINKGMFNKKDLTTLFDFMKYQILEEVLEYEKRPKTSTQESLLQNPDQS